jgi:enoyl-[acyl-carrier protein] reductase I
MVISCFSFTEVAKRAAELMTEGGSMITLTFGASERAMPNYNVMGVAKAALEASVRYLAADLGPQNIRVNAVSAGPIKTLASAGIPGLSTMLQAQRERAPLRRGMELAEIADAAVFLLSNASRAITGEVLMVDGGYHVVGI